MADEFSIADFAPAKEDEFSLADFKGDDKYDEKGLPKFQPPIREDTIEPRSRSIIPEFLKPKKLPFQIEEERLGPERPTDYVRAAQIGARNVVAPILTPHGLAAAGATVVAPEVMTPYWVYQGVKGATEAIPAALAPNISGPERLERGIEAAAATGMAVAPIVHAVGMPEARSVNLETMRRIGAPVEPKLLPERTGEVAAEPEKPAPTPEAAPPAKEAVLPKPQDISKLSAEAFFDQAEQWKNESLDKKGLGPQLRAEAAGRANPDVKAWEEALAAADKDAARIMDEIKADPSTMMKRQKEMVGAGQKHQFFDEGLKAIRKLKAQSPPEGEPKPPVAETKPAVAATEPPKAETPALPAGIEATPLAGKTLGEWEQVTDAKALPAGKQRAALAKWLAVPNQPQRILQALANKKRTREIHAPMAAQVAPVEPTPAPVAEAKSQTKPAKFTLTFQQFLSAPREGELLEGLRKLPKREKSPEEVAAVKGTDDAYAALEKAKLTWMVDHPEQVSNLSKVKQKVWDRYNKAWQDRQRVENAHQQEAQKFLYDEAVKAGLIQTPEDAGELQVQAEIEKQKTGTGPLSNDEKVELNELRITRESRGKLGRLNQASLDHLESRDAAGRPAPAPTPPAPKGIAASVRNKWTSATDDSAPLGSEAGFINLDVIRDFIDSVTPHVKNTFLAVKEIGREATRLTRMTDYRRAVLNWSAKLQRSFGEAAEAQREIKARAPKPDRRDGITNWIQANGDPAVLAERRAATAAWRDPDTGKPHPQQKQLLAGYDAALALTPEEVQVAKDVQGAYGGLGVRGQKWDVLKSFKDNYVTQIWNLGRGPRGTGSSRTLRDRFKFSRASTFPTFFDGEQAGYVPKTKDIAKLLPVYLHEMNTVIAARQLVEQLSKGKASDGRSLVVPRGTGVPIEAGEESKGATLVMPKAVKEGTNDYRTLANQPALSDWRWASRDTAGNPVFLKADLAIHPEAFDRIKAVLGRSAIREWYTSRTSAVAEIPKAIVRGIDFANSETKKAMLGMLATFHQVQEGFHAVGHRVNPTFTIPKIDLVNDAGQMDAARHGLMLLPDRASESQFMEGFKNSGLISKIPAIGPLADHYAHYLFYNYINGLKYKTYEAILGRNLKLFAKELKAGEAKPEDVKVLSAEQVNASYGHLNYADLGRNPTIQHFAQLFLLAPDFLEARARFAGQAARGATGAKVGREQLIALATLAIAQAAAAYTAAKLTDGKWDPKAPFEFTKGTRRYTLRSVPEDVYSLITNTRLFVHSRLSPIIGKGTLQYLSGVDWRGKKVSAAETTKELAEQPIPISVRGFLGVGNSSLSGLEQLAGSVGLKISRYNPDQAKIDAAVKLNDLADSLSSEARKLEMRERYKFVKERLDKDKLSPEEQARVLRKLRQKGVFYYK